MKKFKYYTPLVLQKIGYVLFFPIYKIFVRIEIRGRENLRGLSGPIILAGNHTSELDATIMPLVLPLFSKLFPIYFVSNPTEKFKTFGWRKFFYGGTFFNMLGAYPIFSGRKNYAISLHSHIKLLRKGKTICIFPEGKRTKDGKLNPAHGGLGYLAYVTGAAVVPIAIDTFFNTTPRDFFLCRRKVTVTVCKPISARKIFNGPAISASGRQIKNPCVATFRAASQTALDKIGEVLV
jgi:1-acyl-sn-glycerol-3-phosphate acyltransferase